MLADRSENQQDKQGMNELRSTLDDLDETQWWIEAVAQTPGNQPSRALLLRDIEPVEATGLGTDPQNAC